MIRSKAKAVTIVAAIFVAGLACYSKAQEAKDSTIHKQDIVVEALQGLDYPSLPRLARASGRVVVRVELDEAGKVVSAVALPGATPAFVPDSIFNAQNWRFRPNPGKAAEIVYEFRMLDHYCDEHRSQSLFEFKVPNSVTITGCPAHVQPLTTGENLKGQR